MILISGTTRRFIEPGNNKKNYFRIIKYKILPQINI